ncbi:hypothetical protein DFH09DRAFT_595284 [Mycena vulgaris]|nr:hypothetical protein DFH09DRAFT_595284 [Mycena vulgaris]
MPQPTVTQIRFNNILACLSAAVTTFKVVADSLKTPFLGPISNTMESLLNSVQAIKKRKNDCITMLEQIHELLYAIIHLHMNSDTGPELPPNMLGNLGKFTDTLHKVHIFVEAQQDKSRIKQFFRQGEMNILLKSCHTGLEQAFNVFKVQGLDLLHEVTAMPNHAEKMHQEVLEFIESLSDGANSDRASSISRVLSYSQNSSNSLSLLPSEPKIFHGRDSEVLAIIQNFSQESPRIAILGAGGVTVKTSRPTLQESGLGSASGCLEKMIK